MATKKPQIKAYIEQDLYEKFKIIANKQHRTASNYVELLIIKEIETYEKQNGTISVINMRDNNGTINM